MSGISSQGEGRAGPPGPWWRDRRAVIMVLLGIVSGVIGNYAGEFRWSGGQASVGIVFGVFIGVYLVRIGLATATRAMGFALCSMASWMIAFHSAKWLADGLNPGLILAGIAAGLLGAGLLAISIAVLFPYFRRRRLVVRTTLVGGVFGLLLWPALEWNMVVVLLAPWQAAFALCFALGFPPPRNA